MNNNNLPPTERWTFLLFSSPFVFFRTCLTVTNIFRHNKLHLMGVLWLLAHGSWLMLHSVVVVEVRAQQCIFMEKKLKEPFKDRILVLQLLLFFVRRKSHIISNDVRDRERERKKGNNLLQSTNESSSEIKLNKMFRD